MALRQALQSLSSRGCQAAVLRVTSSLNSLQLFASAPGAAHNPAAGARWPADQCCAGPSRPAGRSFSSTPDPEADEDLEMRVTDRVRRLADEIVDLNLLEVSDLTELLKKKLGISTPVGMPMMGMGMGVMPGAGAAAAAPAEAPVEEEKTEFDVKLEGYDAAAKIKVIKEVRGVTGLGLKESKELVEGAPAVIKAALKKEEAEELKAKLEAVGAKVTLE